MEWVGPSGKNLSRFDFSIGTSPEKAKEVLKRFQGEVQKLVEHPPSSEEMNRVRNLLKGERLISSQSTLMRGQETVVHRAMKRPNIEETIEKLLLVTPEDIQRVAKRYLLQPSVTTVYSEAKSADKLGLPLDSIVELPSDEAFLKGEYKVFKSEK